MVRQWQELFYEHNYSQVNITSPDYEMLAKSY
jgi:acetolactate synthase-1/2/3 large subunit